MVRGKSELQLISDGKERQVIFSKRKEELIRKLHELTTLCDVDGCMIIRPSNQEEISAETEIWPENPDYVSGIVRKYKADPGTRSSRTYTLADLYSFRNSKVLEDIDKKRKKRREMLYPMQAIASLSGLKETQLREFGTHLDKKLDFIMSKIELMKGSSSSIHHHHRRHFFPQNRGIILDGHHLVPQQHQVTITNLNNNNSISTLLLPGASIQRNLDPWEISRIHVPLFQETPHHLQHQIHYPAVNNPLSTMNLMLANQEDCNHGGNCNSSNFNIQFPAFMPGVQHGSSPVSSLDSAVGQRYGYSTVPHLPPFYGQNIHEQSMGTVVPIQYPTTNTMSDVHHVQGQPDSQITWEKDYNELVASLLQ